MESVLHSSASYLPVLALGSALVVVLCVTFINRRPQASLHFRVKPSSKGSSVLLLCAGSLIGFSLSQISQLQKASQACTTSTAPVLRAEGLRTVRGHPIPLEADRLPYNILEPTSDLYLRRLWGEPAEDLRAEMPKNLLVLTVGIKQKENVNHMVSKFSPAHFQVVLFHYDGIVDGWDDLEWSKAAIHIAAKRQSKWWYAKRFLHPDVVETYDYVFLWDEDLGLDNFDGLEYLNLVRKYQLEISQPGLEGGATWMMTVRRQGIDVHKQTEERPGWCPGGPLAPPCAGFVEIMAPVFSRAAWRCIWYMLQNDLIHGWGLDISLQKCAQGLPYDKVGVVDAQWIVHKAVPSLGSQGQAKEGEEPWRGVRARCQREWQLFKERMEAAERLDPRPQVTVVPEQLKPAGQEIGGATG